MADGQAAVRSGSAPGVREVIGLGWPMGTPARTGEVRALLLGTRIDMRAVADMADVGGADSRGHIFVFRYGAVVLFDVAPDAEQQFLIRIADFVRDPLPQPEIETALLAVRPDSEEQVDAAGNIILRERTPERLLLTATVLARSAVLARDEARIAGVFDRIEPLITAMQTRGKVGYRIHHVMRQIGDVLAAQHRMVGRAQIREKPDVLWDHPELDRLYGRLEAEYELGDRARAIEHKLDVIGDAADVLLNVVQDLRSVRLEVAIILLILGEIVLTITERFF